MIEIAKTKKHAIVIGGGLLGLECARGLLDQGMEVTVIHLADWLMDLLQIYKYHIQKSDHFVSSLAFVIYLLQ